MSKRRSPNAVKEETTDSFALLTPEPSADEVCELAGEPAERADCVMVPEKQEPREVAITVPLRASGAPRYSARHVEVQLDNDQAFVLTQVLEALDHEGARLKSGRRVVSSADGLRWLLEQVSLKSAA
jgi:hypothetical protein